MFFNEVQRSKIARLITKYGEEYFCYIYHENRFFYYTDIGIFSKGYIQHVDYLTID